MSILVPYNDPSVTVLDDIARNVVVPKFHASRFDSGDSGQLSTEDSNDRESDRETAEDEISGPDDEEGRSGSDRDKSSTKDNGDGDSDDEHTRVGHMGVSSTPCVPRPHTR